MNHSLQTSSTTLALSSEHAASAHPQRSTPTPLARVGAVLWLWYQRSGSRHELTQLDDHLLDDIGLTREEVAREHRKHFWQD